MCSLLALSQFLETDLGEGDVGGYRFSPWNFSLLFEAYKLIFKGVHYSIYFIILFTPLKRIPGPPCQFRFWVFIIMIFGYTLKVIGYYI